MVRTCCQILIKRWKQIRSIHQEYQLFYIGLGLLLLFVIGLSVGFIASNFHYGVQTARSGIILEVAGIIVGEGLSIFITISVVNKWYARRERKSLQHQLVREVGSRSNEFAKNAVSRLRAEAWLVGDDGLLQGKN